MRKSLKSITAAAFATVAVCAVAAVNPNSITRNGNSYIVSTDSKAVEITPFGDNIFRVATFPLSDDVPFLESKATVLEPGTGEEPKLVIGREAVYFSTPTTVLKVDREDGAVSFFDPAGELLLAEAGGIENSAPLKTVRFQGAEDEIFYGAGERGHSLRLNGDTLVMYNRQNYGYTDTDPRISQMNITVPYFVSDLGYGVLFDDHNKATLALGDTIEYSSETPYGLSYYFINGDGSLAGATESFTALTGRQELPPFWAMGYITSKYGYKTQDETIGVIDTLKRRGYPVDGVVLDLYWYGQETDMGRFEWNKEQWPDHKKMLSDLKNKGVNMVIISQPYINKIGAIDNYNELAAKGMLAKDAEGNVHDVTTWVGEAGMLDVSNPDTRKWLWDKYKALTLEGVEGWWGDLGEPEVHPETIVHANGMTAPEYHNVYGNEWSRIIYEGFKKNFPEKRLMTLMRGGTTGLQRYNVFPWSTDVSRSWGGFQPQVKIMLNSGLSGLGYMSSDIGGFAVDEKNPTDPELYVRWLQMGTFTPTFRTHAQLKPEPYNYPEVEDISLEFIKKRYEWLPYNYTLAYENASAGYPLARPLNFYGDNPDEKYADITDEYLWGQDVLIAPVMTQGARSRKVLFPAGKWIDWNNPALSYDGGTTATVKAPLNVLPMFIREGAFIPQYKLPIENVSQYDPQFLTIKYFPSIEPSEYILFEDDRVSTTSLTDEAYKLITFTGQREGNRIEIGIDSEGNGYKDMPQSKLLTFEIENVAKAPAIVQLSNGVYLDKFPSVKAIRQYGWAYDAKRKMLTVVLPWGYGRENITIE